MVKKKSKDLRLYIHLPIRAYKDKRLQQYRQALFVLAALCSHTNPMGICFPNQSSLAKDLNVSRQAVTRYIKRLMEWGYVRYARKQFKGQKGNSYFIVYDKNTSEAQARKNISLSDFDVPDHEQREAQKTLDKVSGKAVDNLSITRLSGNPRVAKGKGRRNPQVAHEETSEVAHNVSSNVNKDINIINLSKHLLKCMCKAVNEIYAKDIQYNERQHMDAQRMIEEGLKVTDDVTERMKDALKWYREREPYKDAPSHINFFKPWLLPKPVNNSLRNKINKLGNTLRYKSKRNV